MAKKRKHDSMASEDSEQPPPKKSHLNGSSPATAQSSSLSARSNKVPLVSVSTPISERSTKKLDLQTKLNSSISTPAEIPNGSTKKRFSTGGIQQGESENALLASQKAGTSAMKGTARASLGTGVAAGKGPASHSRVAGGAANGSATPSTPDMLSSNQRPNGILKSGSFRRGSADTPGTPLRKVSFPPSENLNGILEKVKAKKATAQELDDLLAHVISNKSKGLALCLDALRRYIGYFDRDHFPIITQIIEIPWSGQEQIVINSFKKLYSTLVSYHPYYSKTIIRCLLRQLMPMFKDEERLPSTPLVRQNIHDFFKKYFSKLPGEKKELIKQVLSIFPYFKAHSEKYISYIRGLFELYSYLVDRQSDILEILVEKLIQLDAGINREHIESFVDFKSKQENNMSEDDEADSEDEEKLDRTAAPTTNGDNVEEEDEGKETLKKLTIGDIRIGDNLDGGMKELFDHLSNKEKTPDGTFLNIFKIYILPSNKIQHVQFSVFFLASQNKEFAKQFLKLNWKIFKEVNKASIIRQAAISYLSGFLCRSLIVSPKDLKKWLRKIIAWIQDYMERDGTHNLDFMVTNLSSHGPFYSASQALFYTIAFRHKDLVVNDDVKFLRDLKLNQLIVHPLNPLHVATPSVVKLFAKTVAHYQIAYCNNIIERNKRITLPVAGLSSSASGITSSSAGPTSEGKPLLLDNYFPFDPYLLPSTRQYIDKHYRTYEKFFPDSDSEDEDHEEEEEEGSSVKDQNEHGSFTSRTRRRTTSETSVGSKRSRTVSLTEAILNDIELEDI